MCAVRERMHQRSIGFAGATAILVGAIVGWTTPSTSILAAEPSATQAFAEAKAARKVNSEKLVSAIGVGQYTVEMQDADDDQPELWTKAKVHVYFERGKYHIQLGYEKMLVAVLTTENGKSTSRLVDKKYDDVRMIVDGDAVYVVKFSKEFQPTGCTGMIFLKEQETFAFATSGFSLSRPARMEFFDIDASLKIAGENPIAYSDLGDGRFRATYSIGKPYMAELDVDRSVGFNVTEFHTFNPERKNVRMSIERATWKQVNETWYADECIREIDTRGSGLKSEHFSRSRFKYDTFDANIKVEPELFTLKSVAIPVGAQFNDRRQNAASPFLYWNGSSLQAERP